MAREYEHEQPQAAPQQTSRRSPARGWEDTEQLAEDRLTPAQEVAHLLRGRRVLQGWAARVAARAGAPTAAAHATHDGHVTHGGHVVQEEMETTHAALTGVQDRDYFAQVQADLAAGKFAGALGLLDRYWPAGARMTSMQEARAYVAGLIVARLHATLTPLKMDAMLRVLADVQTRLGEVIMAGHRLRDLLFAAAHGLDHDRLAFALTVLDQGLNYLEDRQGRQDASLPHYLIDHFDDFTGALTYFQRLHQPVGAGAHAPLQSIGAYVGSNSGVLWGALGDFAAAAATGVRQAVDAIGDSPADYTVTAEAFVGALLPAAAVLAPETFGTSAIIAATLFGAAVTAAATQVSPQETFRAVVLNLMGQPTGALADSFCDTVLNKAEWIVSQAYRGAQEHKWTQNQLELDILKTAFAPSFLKMRPGGVASLDGDAVAAAVKRDVLLLAVPAAGKVVYDYQVGQEAFGPQNMSYTSPATWTYTLTKTVIAVRPELVGALQAELQRGPIEASRIKGLKEFIVHTPDLGTGSDVGKPFGVVFTLDDHDNVQTIVPRDPFLKIDMWSGGRDTPISPTEFERLVVESAWRASKGTPPVSQVSEVVEHYDNF